MIRVLNIRNGSVKKKKIGAKPRNLAVNKLKRKRGAKIR